MKIYCDGERDLFDEDEFLHQKDGSLFQPYIHRKRVHIPEHFADGGYPVVFKDQESAPGPVAFTGAPVPGAVAFADHSHSAPFVVAYHSTLQDDSDWRAVRQSLAAGTQPTTPEIDLHFAGLEWPSPVETPTSDKKAETTKALYQAQLQVLNNRQQGYIDRDKAVRTSDYAFHQAVFQAYLDVAKGQIDRSVTRTQFLATAASAIGTVYTAVIGLSFGLGQPNHTLPGTGIVPAIFLGLALAFAVYYLTFITSQSHLLKQPDPDQKEAGETTIVHGPLLPVQRLFDERNRLIEWVASTVVSRVHWLHAAVISLAMGVVFLPLAFVTLPGWLIWLGVIVGLLAVAFPIAQHYGVISRAPGAPHRQARP
ncbi:MAG TPA: hypothetical protein VKT25_07270 [Ktedonobacteraceae bacterium]|nr:hypothetical protein [Ktedonobacteraceae bacterium]